MTPIVDARQNRIEWTIGLTTYPMDAVYGACYVFIDRCYVWLDKADEKRLQVVLRGKETLDRAALEALAGEFMNELLHQVLRLRLARRTGKVREMIIGRALYAAESPAEEYVFEEDLEGTDADYLDDPLGIAVPWEEKYGAKDQEPPAEEAGPPKDQPV